MEISIGLWAGIGFIFAAYAVVGNDALQTLGTFINSNRNLHWTILFAFAALILVLTFTYGWYVNGGDPSYGRLTNEAKYPVIDIQWYHVLPPAVLLVITRLGIPVSTSFMVLTIFATVGGLSSMLAKSLIGYGLAFATGGLIYLVFSQTLEKWFRSSDLGAFVPRGLIAIVGSTYLIITNWLLAIKDNPDSAPVELLTDLFTSNGTLMGLMAIVFVGEIIANGLAGRDRRLYWVTVQWISTGYLWSVWLIQDFANIFVFLDRELTALEGFSAMAVIVVLMAITFANRGGPVQRILQSKSAITDIRSATIIDLIYASLLFYFKEYSDIPMSTTWVFLGLIAGREYAFALTTKATSFVRTVIDTASDVSKAYLGIVISINLAIGLPLIAQMVAGDSVAFGEIFSSTAFALMVLIANVALLPIAFFAFARSEDSAVSQAVSLRWAILMATLLIGLTTAFFYFKDALSV